jgi:hypothetical protein
MTPEIRPAPGLGNAQAEQSRVMDLEQFFVIRTFAPGRPPWGRWEVYDATGRLSAIVAEERIQRGKAHASTFTVVRNPAGTPFRPPPGRRLRARGAWYSGGHASVPAALAALTRHLAVTPTDRADNLHE